MMCMHNGMGNKDWVLYILFRPVIWLQYIKCVVCLSYNIQLPEKKWLKKSRS